MGTVIFGNLSSLTTANSPDTTYLLEFGTSMQLVGALNADTLPAIDARAAVSGRRFQIDGTVNFSKMGLFIGEFGADSPPTSVTIGATGAFTSVNAITGIALFGNGHSVVNSGIIDLRGAGTGLRLEGNDGVIVNHGYMNANITMSIGGDGHLVTNNATIAGGIGIEIRSLAGDVNRVVNNGLIASSLAVTGDAGREIVVNRGQIQGSINLGDGNDVYINDGGYANGRIIGGGGDDLYVFDRKRLRLEEAGGDGNDTLRTSVTYDDVIQELETIILTGKANINAFAATNNNTIIGNSGANLLSGNKGDDRLTGAGGNDRLEGGAGRDTFIFRRDGSTDTILDYEDEIDLIDIGALSGIKSFASLKRDHLTISGDDLIIVDGDTRIILRDTAKSELDLDDFLF
jgi:Ca2+-binding RTX toxin-like protein